MKRPTDFRPEIRDYLSGGAKKSLLLIGQEQTGLLKDAMDVASFLLGAEKPELCQDYMYVGLGEKEKTIGVEQAAQIVARGALLPATAEKQIILVDSFNKMNEMAQNKLLKLIEESNTAIIIAVAYEDTVLATVKSRMTVVRYLPCSMQEYETSCETASSSPFVLYYLTGGYTACSPDQKLQAIFDSVYKELLGKGFSGIPKVMDILHLIKEKDKASFYELYGEYSGKMLSLVTHSILNAEGMAERTEEMLREYGREMEKISTGSFTKDDFFNFFVQIS